MKAACQPMTFYCPACGKALQSGPTGFSCVACDLPAAPLPWRCFHCDDVFTDRAAAAEHFGGDLQADPACKLNAIEGGLLALVRAQETELQVFRSEDSASYREFYRLGAEHAQALRSAEEKGYARGLADGKSAGAGA